MPVENWLVGSFFSKLLGAESESESEAESAPPHSRLRQRLGPGTPSNLRWFSHEKKSTVMLRFQFHRRRPGVEGSSALPQAGQLLLKPLDCRQPFIEPALYTAVKA